MSWLILWEVLRQGRRTLDQQMFHCCFHGCTRELDKEFAAFILHVCYWNIGDKIMISFIYIHSYIHACYCAMLHTREHSLTIDVLSMVTKDSGHCGPHHCWCCPGQVLLRLQWWDLKDFSVRKFTLKRSQHLAGSKWPQALSCGKVLTRIIVSNPDQYIEPNNYQIRSWSPHSYNNLSGI